MVLHAVQQGECLATIAARYGLDWRVIYTAPENAALRLRRPNPNVLYPGDTVMIPAMHAVGGRVMTGRQHAFTVHRPQWVLRLRLLDHDHQPVAGAAWTLTHAGTEQAITGTTGDDGLVEVPLPHTVHRASLTALGHTRTLDVGGLDPVSRVSGVQQRLLRLGYHPGAVDGVMGHRTRAAVQAFQVDHQGLNPTGVLDHATRQALQALADEDDAVPDWEDDDEPLAEAGGDETDDTDERPPEAHWYDGEGPGDTGNAHGEQGDPG